MTQEIPKWDTLADHFDTYKPEPNKGVLANLDDTWSQLNPFIENLEKKSDANALDFGCGTGRLCQELFERGIRASGIDISAEMIEVAKTNSASGIQYFVGGEEQIPSNENYDLVVSLMVFQFIENLSSTAQTLVDKLKPGGILWFAVHNEDYVCYSNNSHTKFINLNLGGVLRAAEMVLSGVPVQTYIRSADDYRNLISSFGANETLSWLSSPYDDGTPPKYLVMAFQKPL